MILWNTRKYSFDNTASQSSR